MIVTYKLRVSALCPVNGQPDHYDVIVEASDRVIAVETLVELANGCRDRKVFQEDLCRVWAEALHARVTFEGWHSCVHVRSVAGGEP